MANIWDLLVRLKGDGRDFRDDLDKDKVAVDEFNAELKKISDVTAKIKVDDADSRIELDKFKADLKSIRDEAAKINVDDKDAEAKIAALKEQLRGIRNHTALIHVSDADAILKIQQVDAMLDALGRKKVEPKIEPKVDDKKGFSWGALIASLLPAATPIGAAGIGGGMGLLSGATPAAAGGLGFGAVATTTLKPVFEAMSQLKQAEQQYQTLLKDPAATNGQKLAALNQIKQATANLNAEQLKALHSAQDFGNWWTGWSKQFQGNVVSTFTNFLNLIKQGMTGLGPAIKGFSKGLSQLEQDAAKALGGPFWKSFFNWLGQSARQSTLDFGHAIGNLATGFAGLLKAFSPLSSSMDKGLVNLTKRFADWATNLGNNKGFNGFLAYVQQSGPQVVTLISQLGQFLGNALKAMAPLGGPTLALANGILKLANGLLQANPLIGTFVAFGLQSWGISRLISPLGKLGDLLSGKGVEGLTKFLGKIGPVGEALKGIVPIVGKVGSALGALGWPGGLIIAAIIAAVALIITHWKQIKQWWSDFVGWISRLWNNTLKPFFKKWGPDILLVLAPFIGVPLLLQQHWDKIRGWFSQTWDKVKEFMKKWGPDILVVLAPFIGVPLVIKNNWDKIKTYFTNLWTEVKNLLTTWVTDAENFGKNIVNAIAAGITAAAISVEKAIGGIVTTVEQKVQEALGWLGKLLGGGSSSNSSTVSVPSPTSKLPVSPGVSSMVSGKSGTVSVVYSGTINHTGSVTVGGLTPRAVQQVNQHMYTQTVRR